MEQSHLVPAQLDESTVAKLQSLEQSLYDTSGEQIVIVAYKPSKSTHQSEH